jgi:hypothetical protein
MPTFACVAPIACSQAPTAAATQQPTVPATSKPTAAVVTQQPTAAPSVAQQPLTTTAPKPSTISVSLSTVISNMTIATFNETAFIAAVIEVISATVLPTVTVPQVVVVITSAPQATSTTSAALIGDSHNRHLQAADSRVTVAYNITNIPDTATATAIQTQLPSKASNDKLLNSYETLDNSTSATAITTTVVNAPTVPPSKSSKSSQVGAIVGAVIGIVVVAAIAYMAWRERDAIKARIPKRHSTTTTTTETVIKTDNDVKDRGGSFSKATTVADNPRRNSSDRKSGSMLIHLDSGIIIDSVHNDVSSTDDDIEHGIKSTTSIIDDNSSVINANNTDQVLPASSTSTTAYDTTIPTEQHETSVVLSTSDITAPIDNTTIDTTSRLTTTETDSTTSDTTTDNRRALVVQPTANEAIDTVSELAVVTKKQPFWANRIGQASRLVTTRMSTATQKAVAQHGDKAILAYELVGAVAEHIPYVRHAYGLCDEIVQLFGAGVHIDSNCAEVVAWAKDMQVKSIHCGIHISTHM